MKLLPIALLLLPLAASAGDWTGSLGASLLVTDGNSQSRSVGAKVNAVYTADPWKNTLDGSATNVSGSNGQTAERYAASDKLDYNFTAHTYGYVAGDWQKDLFGPVRVTTSETVGIGRHFLRGPEHFLDGDIGGGARQTQDNVTGLRHSDLIARATGHYQWKFADKNSFSEDVKVESGSSNTFSQSVTALNLAVIGSLSAVISYTIRHNSDVPTGTEHIDSETAVNIVYVFSTKQ